MSMVTLAMLKMQPKKTKLPWSSEKKINKSENRRMGPCIYNNPQVPGLTWGHSLGACKLDAVPGTNGLIQHSSFKSFTSFGLYHWFLGDRYQVHIHLYRGASVKASRRCSVICLYLHSQRAGGLGFESRVPDAKPCSQPCASLPPP